MTTEQIDLLRKVIATKVAFWDALRALEVATAPEGEWRDWVNDAFIETIDNIASGCDTANDSIVVSDEDLIASFGRLVVAA